MKKLLILLGAIALTATLSLAEGKCGEGKYEDSKKTEKKCDSGKKSDSGKCNKSKKCDSGKCNGDKESNKKVPEKGKCGQGKCG